MSKTFMYKLRRKFDKLVTTPVKSLLIENYDQFRLWELTFRMKHCHYEILIEDYTDFVLQVGENTANRVFESMMEECYNEPRRYGQSLDREGGNWLFRNHRYFCNDSLLVEFTVQDGNWNGTEVEIFEVTYE